MPFADADKARRYWAEYRRLRRTGNSSTPCSTPLPAGFRLEVVADVLALLEDQAAAVLEDSGLDTVTRARTIGYLTGLVLKAIEAGNVAARLEALENVLKTRKASA